MRKIKADINWYLTKYHDMWMCVAVEVLAPCIINLDTRWCKLLASRSGGLTLRKETQYPLTGRDLCPRLDIIKRSLEDAG